MASENSRAQRSRQDRDPEARRRRQEAGRTELGRALRSARTSLVLLVVVIAGLIGLLGWGTSQGHTGWGPRLALDLEGGTQMVLTPELKGDQQGQEISEDQLNQAVEIIRQRVDGSGVSEAEVSTQGGRNIVVSMPGEPSQETRDLIQTSAQMEFRPVLQTGPAEPTPQDKRTPEDKLPEPSGQPKDSSDINWITPQVIKDFEKTDCTTPQTPEQRGNQPADQAIVACSPSTQEKLILGPVDITGERIASSDYGMPQGAGGGSTGQWAVDIQFDEQGTETFKQLSERLHGIGQTSPGDARNRFAILLDGEVISSPTMDATIPNGQAQISGSFTEDSAKFLSEQLRYGALPVSFTIASEQQVSASLGADQLQMGIIAGLIGLALVALYCLWQYRLLGLVTIVSLLVLAVLSWLAIVLLGWGMNYRLSLAGMAGLIVSIGMAADSFIVYFERIRDEVRIGRTIPAAIDHGWKRARQTIIASKAVNLLASVVLYFVAVGNVRGFAFTLGLTAVLDLVIVFLFTHPVMVLLSRTRFFAQGRKGSGLDPESLDAVPFYRGAGRTRSPEDLDPSAGDLQVPTGQDADDADDAAAAAARRADSPEEAEHERAPEPVALGTGDGLTVAERRRQARRAAQQRRSEHTPADGRTDTQGSGSTRARTSKEED